MGLKIVTLIPTRFGLEDTTAAAYKTLADVMRAGGHEVLEPIPIAGTYIDQVRAELVCAGLTTDANTMLLLDDDVTLTTPSDILKVLRAIEHGIDVIAIPYVDRRKFSFFIARCSDDVEQVGDLSFVEASAITLGMTLVRRSVLESLNAHYQELRYASDCIPDGIACALFQPSVMAASDLPDVRTKHARLYVSEDKMFCVRARAIGVKLHAALGLETSHRGLRGTPTL